jgi:hypothetical protein
MLFCMLSQLISSSSSSAHYSTLLDIGLSNISPSRSILISTWPEGVLHYVYRVAVSTPELVYPSVSRFYGWPARRHFSMLICYVGDFSSLSDYLVSDSIPQRNPEHSSFHSLLSNPVFVDQPCHECPRLGSVCHDR